MTGRIRQLLILMRDARGRFTRVRATSPAPRPRPRRRRPRQVPTAVQLALF